MKWLQPLKDRFRGARSKPSALLTVSETVRYAGPDNDTATPDGTFEFGIETDVNGEAIWLPAITNHPAVIKALKEMPIGQPFIITHEENWGGMGTRVNGIQLQIGGDNLAAAITAAQDGAQPEQSAIPIAPEIGADIAALKPANIRKRTPRAPA
ncbi:MAG: hypothetical protein Q8K65_09175 [Alphaproteobacteria bacterium]|nr:hypothetical protein [Alphaproteobacteria bacterium]